MFDDQSQTTVVQRTLHMPEILSVIFMWINLDTKCWVQEPNPHDPEEAHWYAKEGVLARCGLVNKFWFNEAMRWLWMIPTVGWTLNSLPLLFVDIPARERRQFYASFIEEAILVTVDSDSPEAEEHDEALRGIPFPKLRFVHMMMQGYYNARGVHIPVIQHHRITELEIDPPHDVNPVTYGVSRDELDVLLEQIPVVFPHLEKLIFSDSTQRNRGSLERLRKRLPYLKTFDRDRVDSS